MEALKFFWQTKEVDMRSKCLIFMAIPLNLLLWGCESWALTKGLIKQLEVLSYEISTKHFRDKVVRSS